MNKPTKEFNAEQISQMFNEQEQCVRCMRIEPIELLIKKEVGKNHWFYCECCFAELFWNEQFKKGPVV